MELARSESTQASYHRVTQADFFTVDLDDLSIAGHCDEDLLPLAVFSLNRTAIRDVIVNGRWVVRDGRHPLREEIVSRYRDLHEKLWVVGNVKKVSCAFSPGSR